MTSMRTRRSHGIRTPALPFEFVRKPIPRCPADIAVDLIAEEIDLKKWDHRDFAERVGCGAKHLSQVLNREKDPTIKLLRAMWIEAMR